MVERHSIRLCTEMLNFLGRIRMPKSAFLIRRVTKLCQPRPRVSCGEPSKLSFSIVCYIAMRQEVTAPRNHHNPLHMHACEPIEIFDRGSFSSWTGDDGNGKRTFATQRRRRNGMGSFVRYGFVWTLLTDPRDNDNRRQIAARVPTMAEKQATQSVPLSIFLRRRRGDWRLAAESLV